jgi:hypothetical protein
MFYTACTGAQSVFYHERKKPMNESYFAYENGRSVFRRKINYSKEFSEASG